MGTSAPPTDPGVIASGPFAGGRLIHVLRQIVRDGGSGLLTVEPDGGEFEEADLLFIGGQLRAVRFAALTGAQALTRVLVLGGGQWRLEHCSDPPPHNFSGDTGAILDQVDNVLRDCDLAAALGVESPAPLDAADLAAAIDEAATKGVNTATFTRTARIGGGTATIAVGSAYRIPQSGDLLGRYALIREIGHGASSMVYLAHHTTLDVDVVVKVLLPAALHDGSTGAETPSAAAMTANEARILARLNHPNIMRVFDFDDQGEQPYLVMEHIAGRSLLAMIREQSRLPVDRALTVIRQVARGLAQAHHQVGLIHNDLKPANILVAEDGSAKLADFALASMRAMRGDQRGTTTSLKKTLKGPQVMGTPAYVAPEAVRAGMAEPGVTIDHRADIYALGATLYHALTGRTLFSHPDAAKLMLMHVHDTWTPAEHLVPDLDPQVGAMLDRMLAKRVEDRYQTWGELVADLDRLSGKGAGRRTSFFKTMVGKVWKVA